MSSAGPSRRQVLVGLLGAGALAGLSSCGLGTDPRPTPTSATFAPTPARSGPVRDFRLTAGPLSVDLGGQVVSTWAYGGSIPGRALRVTAGDRVRVDFTNSLPVSTSVHWHGLAIVNAMDGVPGITTPETAPGGQFSFDFVVADAGTHWFHPHTGLQLDRGLYAPFIVDDPGDPGAYDLEWVVVLDDWTDGVGPSPEAILAGLQASGGSMMGPMMGRGPGPGGGMGMMSGGGGDVNYPLYLLNGRPPGDPEVLRAKPGQVVRLRIINAASDTIFHLAVGGHELVVTHTDGYPVRPARTGVLRIGMGERYDSLVTIDSGVFPVVAEPWGKRGLARALIRTGAGAAPPAAARPTQLDGTPLTVEALTVAEGSALPAREPDSVQPLALAAAMGGYVWTINGRTYDQAEPLTIEEGQAGRLAITNHSMMSHPVHLHGHSFQLGAAGGFGPRKDTVLVPPMSAREVDFAATNPGSWMIHCHNAYHAEVGMMTRLEYRT